jgi:hypothetical protein
MDRAFSEEVVTIFLALELEDPVATTYDRRYIA